MSEFVCPAEVLDEAFDRAGDDLVLGGDLDPYDRGYQAGVAACREKIEAAIEKRPGDTDLSGQPLLPGWISASMLLKPDAPVSAFDTDKEKEADHE
jgi:hypothetical protein